MRMGMGRGVEEAVAGIAGLQALGRAHEAGDAVDRCCAGQRRGHPGVQGKGVGHWTHVGVHMWWVVEGEHG